MLRLSLLTSLVVVSLLAGDVRSENWPNWRGPRNNGISNEKNLPVEFGPEKNVAWKLKLPGIGGATPVVWGDNIFVTSIEGENQVLQCISTDGKVNWQYTVGTGNKNVRGDEGNTAANSPSTDGEHVWAMFADGNLVCYTVEGEKKWQVDLDKRYGPFSIAFGLTSTPVLDDGRLYIQMIHGKMDLNGSRGVVACLDAANGREIWKQIRATDGVRENKHSYASPMMYDYGGTKYLLTHGADFVIAHDVDSGKELWRCGNLNVKEKYDNTLRFVASPACAEGIIVVPTAKRGPVRVLGPNGKGDITRSAKDHLWSHDKTPDVPSPLIYGGLVYLCMQDGNLFCLDQANGRQYYFERTHRQRHRASPVYADGHLYLTARDGVVSVVKAGRKFELVAQNEMGDSIAASPAISGSTIYLRSFGSLWAIRK